ncbi:uroporphyrinogen-III synthase [Massilia endophytica]|uniref:uroporphyrinogen-III synthase n=1 Tax=Massilia endophytica TaxID=2899220 RepID=UPI001E5D3DA5|nr:uroporphyrinogen-III synthase [Massilia endophytica]UGQ47920.1 uroporphyrinogen-III synthase [Massilia endophytica]
MSTVVITRPLAQAQPLAARIAALGRDVAVLPLLDISPLPDTTALRATLARAADYALLAFVSPNAVDAAFPHIPQWPHGLGAAVVGEGSRAALLAHGVPAQDIVSPADPAASDSEHLLKALDLEALQGRRVLIVRGESGRELLADSLRAAGVLVDTVAAYRRAVPPLDDAFAARLSELTAEPNDWIVTSSEALRGLLRRLEELDGQAAVAKMQRQHLLVPHARIAETAKLAGFHRVTLTGSGDDRLVAALQLRS